MVMNLMLLMMVKKGAFFEFDDGDESNVVDDGEEKNRRIKESIF
jgi:hypothetical protein